MGQVCRHGPKKRIVETYGKHSVHATLKSALGTTSAPSNDVSTEKNQINKGKKLNNKTKSVLVN